MQNPIEIDTISQGGTLIIERYTGTTNKITIRAPIAYNETNVIVALNGINYSVSFEVSENGDGNTYDNNVVLNLICFVPSLLSLENGSLVETYA